MFGINGAVDKQRVGIWKLEHADEPNLVATIRWGDMTWPATSKEPIKVPYSVESPNATDGSYRNIPIHYAFPRFRLPRED